MNILITALDGTLYPQDDDGRLLTMNIQALNKWYENGHKLIIVTSRGLGHLEELKKKITFPFTFSGADGAIILNEKDELKIHSIKGQIYNEIAKDALTIQAPHARKDKAVSDIINTLTLSPDNTYIVGDSNDDIAIFKLTQNSYCMEDGEKLAKIYAHHLTSSIYDLIFNKLSRLLI